MIVVSGATGFLGAHFVCHLLQKDLRVRGLKRKDSSLDEFNYIFDTYFENCNREEREYVLSRLEWHIADILDIPSLEEALKDATDVYHCAGMVSFLQKHREQVMQVNVEGTTNMVNVSISKKVSRFCFVSSIASLGRLKTGSHLDEKNRWVDSNLNTNYSLSKYKAEIEVWRGIEEGLNAVIVNPGVIIGVGDWNKGSLKLFDICRKKFPFYTTGIGGYVDVRDVAKAMYGLMQTPDAFRERYILVGSNLETKYFMHKVAELLNVSKAKFRVTPFMAEVAWIYFGIVSLFNRKDAAVTRETARASLNRFFYNSEKIKRAISFEFTGIEETLIYICEKLKRQPIQ